MKIKRFFSLIICFCILYSLFIIADNTVFAREGDLPPADTVQILNNIYGAGIFKVSSENMTNADVQQIITEAGWSTNYNVADNSNLTRANACVILAEAFEISVSADEEHIVKLWELGIVDGKVTEGELELSKDGTVSFTAFAILTYRLLEYTDSDIVNQNINFLNIVKKLNKIYGEDVFSGSNEDMTNANAKELIDKTGWGVVYSEADTNNLTRGEACTILVEAFGFSIGEMAPINYLNEKGVINGYNNNGEIDLAPDGNISFVGVAVATYRILQKINDEIDVGESSEVEKLNKLYGDGVFKNSTTVMKHKNIKGILLATDWTTAFYYGIGKTENANIKRIGACELLAKAFKIEIPVGMTAIKYFYDEEIIDGEKNNDGTPKLNPEGDVSFVDFANLTYSVLKYKNIINVKDIKIFEDETPLNYECGLVKKDNTVSYYINIDSNTSVSGDCIIVLYNGDKLVDYVVENTENKTLCELVGDKIINGNPNRYKFLLWNDLELLKPICDFADGVIQ